MSFQLPELPYAKDALEPHISKETLEYHHDKHHATYVTKLNGLVKGTEYETKTIEEIITSKPATGIFNNAAQAYNHDFYWKCMAPNGVKPSEKMLQKINEAFGSFEEFKKQLDLIPRFTSVQIMNAIQATRKATGVKGRKLFMPIRIATTRSMVGPGIGEAMELLGKERVVEHIDLTLKQMSANNL